MRGASPAAECDPLLPIEICARADDIRFRAVAALKAHAFDVAHRCGLEVDKLRVAYAQTLIRVCRAASVSWSRFRSPDRVLPC
jgi:hypothetical protein